MKEEWKEIEGYEGRYEVSNHGRIKSHTKGEIIMSLGIDTGGYANVGLKLNGRTTRTVHTLVWDCFGNQPRDGRKLQVDHIDGNKLNNQINNLQLLSNRANVTKHHKRQRNLPTGVYRIRNKYQAKIRKGADRISLGYYDTPEDASLSYQEALNKITKQTEVANG